MLAAGGRTDLSARGDGGTPLIAALFWGHREVVPLLGLEPGNLRVAAGLGLLDMIRGARRDAARPAPTAAFYRPHGGFPAWQPSDDPQEVLDEALVWAAKGGRVEALAPLVDLGADVNADPYRGTALTWAAVNGRVDAVRALVELGAELDRLGTFGGPDHGAGVPAINVAAQAGQNGGSRSAPRRGRRPDDPGRDPRRSRRRVGGVRRASEAGRPHPRAGREGSRMTT